MGAVGTGAELRMELRGDKVWMAGDLDDLHQAVVRRQPGADQALFRQEFPVLVVEFIAMPMPLVDTRRSIQALGQRPGFELALIGSEPHGGAFIYNISLLGQNMDQRVR